MNLQRNMSWTALLQIANMLFPIITLPLLLSILGLSDYGKFLIISSLVGIYIIIVDFGSSVYALKLLSKRRLNKSSYSNIYSQILWIKVAIFILTSIFFSIGCNYMGKSDYIIPTLFLSLSQSFIFNVYYQSIENNKPLAIFTGLIKVFFITPILGVVTVNNINLSLNTVIYFYTLSFTFITLFSVYGYLKAYHLKKPNIKIISILFKNSSGFFFSRVSVLSYTRVNTVLVGILWDEEIAAYFGTAEKVYNAIRSIYAPISNALYPYMSRTKNIVLFRKIFIIACSINILTIVAVYIIIEYGKDSILILDLASHYFYLFGFSLLFTTPSVLYGYPFLGALGSSRAVNLSTLYGSLIYYVFIVVGFLLFGYQVEIIIYGIVSTEIFVFAYRYKNVRRIIKS